MTRKNDGSYHTCFGPCGAHNGEVYARNNANISKAMTRLTNSRTPLVEGYEQYMQQCQTAYVRQKSQFLGALKDSYFQEFREYLNMELEAELHHADPHAKRLLRIQAWDDILSCSLLPDFTWHLPHTKTAYKMKIFEIAKPKKVPRMIGDLGVHASLQGFRITDFLKKAMARRHIEINGGKIEFIPKPTPSALERVFKQLIEPEGRFYFVLFSDDSCLALRSGDRILRFNVDISSCDASHTKSLFEALSSLAPDCFLGEMQRLVRQCQEKIVIRDENNKSRRVTLKPRAPRLYSGSTLTTIMNNLANILIGLSISESVITNARDVQRAAARCGYIVTCEDCDDWHKLQFLKHSPVLDTSGHIRPLLNPGVLIRLSGTCKGDLPGRKTVPLSVRAARFQSSLLRGVSPKASYPMLDRMRAKFNVPSPECDLVVAKELRYKAVHEDTYPNFSVTSSECWARYDLSALEIHELDVVFGGCGTGDHYNSAGLSKVLLADYGLSCSQYPTDFSTAQPLLFMD
jgi:hypothetical protein